MAEETKQKILVVENNLKYLDAAKEYFASFPSAQFIIDYENAKAALPNYKNGKALVDVFIPESEKVRLGEKGKALIKHFRKELENQKNYCFVESLREENKPYYWSILRLVKEKDKELYGSLKDYAKNRNYKLDDSTFLELPLIKKALDNFRGIFPEYGQKVKKLDEELEALAKEEAIGHSPLGIKLMKQSQELGVPACFVTDGNHHGPIYDAIKRVFFDGKMPPTKFGYGDKDKEFWKAAYEMLK